ncbi:hypothetical protein MJH12_03890 [bacterium]|nr:hypothetical protein [bacterium]
MKKLKTLFDLLLIGALFLSIYFFHFKKSPPKEIWSNTFQSYPWKELQSVQISHRNFSIHIVDQKVSLKTKKDQYDITWETLQSYLDNLLILPEYTFFEQKESDLSYGFQDQQVEFHFKNEKHTLNLGKNLSADSSKFYLSLDRKAFTLASVLRQNIDWPVEYFFPKSPIPSKSKKITLYYQNLQKEALIIVQKNNQYQVINSSLALNPYQAFQAIFTMKSQVHLDPIIDESSCIAFVEYDSKKIELCDKIFYSPNDKLAWPLSSKIQTLIQQFDLKLLSNQFSDFVNFDLDSLNSVKFPNNLVINLHDKNFGYLQKLIQNNQVHFVKRSSIGLLNQTFILSNPHKSQSFQGYFIDDQSFIFHVQNDIYALIPFKKFQAIYQ